jgi:hypothetical protein
MRRLILASFLVIPAIAVAADKQLLWGDTHLHTSYSPDAYMNNNFSADPHTAYRYAMGEPVIHPYHRARVQIGTPLDFLVVSDHAEFLGVIRRIHQQGVDTEGLGIWASIKARIAAWYVNRALDERNAFELFFDVLPAPGDVRETAAGTEGLGEDASVLPPMPQASIDTWRSQTEIADEYYRPGTFTTFIGWEWSSMPGAANLHRVVMTDADKTAAQTFQPFSLQDSMYPEDLWTWLENISAATGAQFLSIPHNSNVSKGYMFDTVRLRGTAFDEDYIARRMKFEPIVEVTQIKGDSESHPSLSPGDDFADFEEFPFYLTPHYTDYVVQPGDYVRSALKRGLALAQEQDWRWHRSTAAIPTSLALSAPPTHIPRSPAPRKTTSGERWRQIPRRKPRSATWAAARCRTAGPCPLPASPRCGPRRIPANPSWPL